MNTKSFLPQSIVAEATQMGAEYTADQEAANSSGLLAELHNSFGNQEILNRISPLRPERTAGERPSGERVPVLSVMSTNGLGVPDYIGQPGLLVDDSWQQELPMVAAGSGSVTGDQATLVEASELFECQDEAECSRHINRDLDLIRLLLPGSADQLQARIEDQARAVLGDSQALLSSLGVFSFAVDVGIRTLAASSGIGALIGAAATATLHTAIRREISSQIKSFASTEWLPGDVVSGFFLCFTNSWMTSFTDAQKVLEGGGDFEALRAFADWVEMLSTFQYGELESFFQGAILESFLSFAGQSASADVGSQHTSDSLSGVYNFKLVFDMARGWPVPQQLGLPITLSPQDAELVQKLPGIWQTQTFELISADQSLILQASGSRVSITKAEQGAVRALQELGVTDVSALDELRLKASEGDRDAQSTLAAIEQRGAEKIWERCLEMVGPDTCINDVPELQILRRN